MVRLETPHQNTTSVVAGHFNEGPDYAVTRAAGTRDWLLIATVSGQGRFGSNGPDLLADPGDLVMLRPGTRHDYAVSPSSGRWELLWAHLQPRPHWIDLLDWPEAAPGLHRLSAPVGAMRDKAFTAMREVNQYANSAHRRRDALAMHALERTLLICDELNPRSAQSLLDTRVRDAMEYICNHLTEQISLDAIAEAANLSTSRLSYLFKRQTGAAPIQFLETQRLARAKQLLEFTSHSVKEIAARVGFDSPFYFSSRFSRQVGLSPKAYRTRQHETGPMPNRR